MGASAPAQNNAVGQELARVLPQDNKKWYTRAHLLRLNFVIISLCQFASTNGFDGSIMNGILALPVWTEFMDSPTGAWLGFINAIYWLGNFLAVPIATLVTNKWGRKPVIYSGYLLLIPGVILQTAAHNDVAFVMARMLLGAASGFYSVGVPLLINEIAYPAHRGIASAMFNTGWYVGSIVAAFVTFGTRNYTSSWGWRIPSLLQIILPMVALPGLIMSPESPRWLVAKGRNEQARKVLADNHAGGENDAPLVLYEVHEIEATIAAEQSAKESASYADMIKTKGNRWRLGITMSLAVFSQWSGNGVVSYYFALVLKSVGITKVADQLLISAGMQIWNLIFAVAAAACVDRLGRRVLFLASGTVMLISYIIVTGLSAGFANTGSSSVGAAVVPFLFFYFAGYDIAL
jgi:MFS family permease